MSEKAVSLTAEEMALVMEDLPEAVAESIKRAFLLGYSRGKAEREESELCRSCGLRRLCGEDWQLNKESPF